MDIAFKLMFNAFKDGLRQPVIRGLFFSINHALQPRSHRQLRDGKKYQIEQMTPLHNRTFDATQELKKGIALHQSGNFIQAEEHYRKILARNPHHPDALHLLGVIAHQGGRSDVAVLLIKKAIRNNHDNPFYYNNLGAALREMGAQDEAVANYQKALQLKPEYAEAAYNMGSVLLLTGRLSEAVSWYEKAIQIKPDYVDAYSNLAAGYNKLNRPNDALTCCQKVLKLNPNNAVALNNMGNALMAREKQAEAITEQLCQLAGRLTQEANVHGADALFVTDGLIAIWEMPFMIWAGRTRHWPVTGARWS